MGLMPQRPAKFRMPKPARSAPRERPTASQRGYNYRWQQASKAFLALQPLCVKCPKPTTATCVDHITPHRGDQQLFWDVDNWQALCERCHNRKTRRGE